MESTEFPVGRLLNGDSYKAQTRMKNISSAMNWIQKQMESLRESDKQLLSLFTKLETDMVDLKTLCMEGGRIRTASMSSTVGLLQQENSSASIRYMENFNTSNRILEESGSEYKLERSSSNDSLENFADLLGDDDDVLPTRHSPKSQGSTFSSEFNSNFSLHDNDRISGGGDIRGLDDALSITSQSSGSSTRLNTQNTSPRLSQKGPNGKRRSHYSSNDSGALVDSEMNSNYGTGPESSFTSSNITDNSLTATLTDATNYKRESTRLGLASDTSGKRESSGLGLAGEIFALLNMK